MNSKIEKKYQGIIVPMITPFTDSGEIDIEAAVRIIEYLDKYDSETLLFGTTGETASITKDKKIRAFAEIAKRYNGKGRLYAAISDNALDDAADLANAFLDNGAEAVVTLLPGYYPITKDQMLRYMEAFVERITGNMFLYNIPATTHLSLPLDVIDKLSHHERIVGLKDSERDLERLDKSIEMWHGRKDFSHYIGWGAQCYSGLLKGSDGIVPSTANFSAMIYRDLVQAVRSGDEAAGERAQQISSELAQIYQKDKILSQSLPALKVMMAEVGLCGTKVTTPFTQLTENDEAEIREKTRAAISTYDLEWK